MISHLNPTLNSKHVFDYQRNRNFYSSRELQKNVAFNQSLRSMDIVRAYLIASFWCKFMSYCRQRLRVRAEE